MKQGNKNSQPISAPMVVQQRRRNDPFRQVLDVADVFLVGVGADERVNLINRRGCEILGLQEHEVLGRKWFDHFIPESLRGKTRRIFQKIIAGSLEAAEYFENPVLTARGEEVSLIWHNAVLKGKDGKIIGTLSSGNIKTPDLQAEMALRDSERALRTVVETVVDGIITINEEGKIVSFNSAAQRIFGFHSGEVVGEDVSLLMPEPDRSRHSEYLDRYRSTGKKRIIGRGREVIGQRKDGTTFPMYLAVSEFFLGGRRMYTGLARDLTEFKRMQEEMLHSQKLAAIGEMAASVAHEIKNPLAGIGGAIEILRDTLEGDDPRREVMNEILEEVSRLDNTVRDLLAFSRPWSPDLQECNIPELSERVIKSFQEQEARSDISFVFENTLKRTARLDPWLLEKVLWNLLDNAQQAMPQGGEIRFQFEESPGRVSVSVIDSGQGIPSEIVNDVFRPFFTTRNRGTGLGLAICKKIMDAHGGAICVSSQLGNGTRVRLDFNV